MCKWALSILFILVLSPNIWAQNDVFDEETTEEFNKQIDSLNGLESEEDFSDEAYASEEEYEAPAKQSASDDELELRKVDEEEWKKLKKDKRFIYKKKKVKEPKVKEFKERKPWFEGFADFFNTGLFKFLLYLLLAGFLVYIVYLFVKNNDISFRKNIKDEGVVQEAPWEDVQQFDDWELALQKALEQKDYRLATRIYYLHTLHLLDKNQYVQYREDKTNWFYVQKLFGKDLHDDFKGLTQSFDYIWYGEYQVNDEQFKILQNQFQKFHARIA